MKKVDVLVIGSGFSGLGAALALANKHYSVLILERDFVPGGLLKDVCRGTGRLAPLLNLTEQNPNVSLITGATLKSIGGYHPLFSITWVKDGQLNHADAAHIIFAMGLDFRFPRQLHLEGPGDGLMILPELEITVCDNDWSVYSDKAILMIAGYQEPVSSYGTHLMLDRALALVIAGARVVMVLPNVLLHSADTTLLYRQCREAGVLFIQAPQPPIVSGTSPLLRFEAVDPSLSDNGRPAVVQGTVDIVIFEPEYIPRTLPNIFWSPHHPSIDASGFYSADTPRLLPVQSERRGVFYVGAVSGFKSLADCREEVALAVAEILIQHPENPQHIEVDEKKCVACLTCVRLCPHRAIHIDGTAQVSVESCTGCGICVAACPAAAITLIKPDSTNLKDGMVPLPDYLPEWVVLYGCDGSTGPTWDSIQPNLLKEKYHIHYLRVSCSGTIAVSTLLGHLKAGAAGILIAACQMNCCDHFHGNKLAANRVLRVQNMLRALGMDPDRIKLVHVAQGMDKTLIEEVENFCSRYLSPENSPTKVDKESS